MIAGLFAVLPRVVEAQTLSTGVIVGAVTDERGDPANGVTITISNRANGQRVLARTDRSGTFGSELLPPGHYDALFERLGNRPHRVEDILVVAGASQDVRVSLDVLAPQDTMASTSAAPVAQSVAGGAGPDRWLVGQPVASMPLEGNGLSALLQTSSIAGARNEIEGLPATHAVVVIDGVPFVRRPRGFDVFAIQNAVPLYALTQTGLITNNPDVEYPGAAASLMAHTRRGGRERGLSGFGDFASDATASGFAEPPSFTAYRAGAIAEGPIVRDTASFVVGGEILRSRSPFDAFWTNDAAAAALVNAAANTFSTDLNGYTTPSLATVDRESVYGRFDMRFSETTTLSAYGIYATMDQPEPVAPWTERPIGSTLTPRLRNILAGASFVVRIDDDMMSQVDAGFESSRSLERPQADRGQALPQTTIVDAGRQFGSPRSQQFLGEILSFFVRGTLHFRSGTHWRKLGISAELPAYKVPYDGARAGSFTFPNLDDYRNGYGFYRAIEGGTRNRADFSTRRISIIGQDVWRPSPTVQVLAGARISSFRAPDSADVTPDQGWVNLAAQSNRAFPGRKIEFEPRFVITVSPATAQSLVLRGGVMVDGDVADPDVIGEIFSNNGTLSVRSGLGDIPAWPSSPASPGIMLRDPSLSIIGPDFRGPRSTRAFGSLSNTFGSIGALTLGFTYRRTEFLPQRVDLNRLPGVTGYDQHGRPIYGQLDKRSGMLTARYGTNRRFGAYEEVWGLQATGESRYTGVTISAERSLAGPVGFFGSYTWSKTEDDWLLGRLGDPFTQLAPFDSIGPEDWTMGVSDLDVPHRAVAGLEVVLPGSFTPRVAALFRYQSGYPFTPGFRPGVDVNADGSGYNDPAFIDTSVSGMAGVLESWPCLQESAGQFVARNACRGPGIKGLDARFSLTFQQAAQYSASLVVDGLNLISSDAGEVDAALYLVDPDQSLDIQADGTVGIPLIANPDFGRLLTRYSPQRMLRVGVRVSF
jgi:hypothetical protein